MQQKSISERRNLKNLPKLVIPKIYTTCLSSTSTVYHANLPLPETPQSGEYSSHSRISQSEIYENDKIVNSHDGNNSQENKIYPALISPRLLQYRPKSITTLFQMMDTLALEMIHGQ